MNKSKSAFVGRLNELQKNDGGDAAFMADPEHSGEAIIPFNQPSRPEAFL